MRYIIKKMEKLHDPRQAWKVKHRLADILAISIVAVMCGAQSSLEIQAFGKLREAWFRRFLELPNGMPSRLTFERVLRMINPREFSRVFTEIMQHIQHTSKGAFIAIDGKCCYSKTKNGGRENNLYIVSAWQSANSAILGQVNTSDKSNEITAIPELLRLLSIKDAVVTIDAIGCQKSIVKQIVQKNRADYAISLKKNQPDMLQEMTEYAEYCLSEPDERAAYSTYTTCEKGHGRIEKRRYFMFHDLSWFDKREDWAKLQSLVMVKSERTVRGITTTEDARYYITSLTDVRTAAHAIRSHWGIENGLHWVLDVVFREDQWATKAEIAAQNLATVRKLALAFLRKIDFPDSHKLSGPLKMWRCALDLDSLDFVLFNDSVFS